ncbi:response regulator [Candidatus Symbiobacter mobilis]|uniref:CheY-like chemotaxis protein n=1 Tax=Candidatus Symbiobacter mobilis CR TaxID=946483 RepID=U5N7D1_9BURK|nr:response regulator [Candidatus Symbiobacter mobilis]AGX87297.1 CheY-like chemotaxis protein [Candidatus Symbiobacter mobilis CR]
MANILVIDDDEQFRAMLTQMLTQERHRVTAATDGKMGLELLSHFTPDLIITDILMPNKDGIELILELVHKGCTIPMIAISGGRRSIHAQFNLDSATLMGVNATLTKPFTREDLRNAIRQVLAGSGS